MDNDSIVVIGSGPAGAMAAHELVNRHLPVTMLEAGSEDPRGVLVRAAGRNLLRRTPALERESRLVVSGHPDTAWFRTLGLGGLSNQWTGAVPRFAPDDFWDGARLDERYRWPLDYDDIAPFYDRAERLLRITASGTDVPLLPAGYSDHRRILPHDWTGVARVAAQQGQGLTVMPLADGPDFLFARRATAFNSYSNIVRQLTTRPNFTLRTKCTALQLEWSSAKRRVEGVVFHDRDTDAQQRIEASAVVVACGPLGSTKLLFDSTSPDFPQGLGNNEGVLGRYLHDHPKEWWSVRLSKPITRLACAAYLTRRPFDQTPPLMATSWTIGLASPREKVLSLFPGRTSALGVQVLGTMIPSERFYVRPHASQKDEFGLPQLEIYIEFDEDVLKNVHAARSWFMDLLGDAGFECRLNPVVPQCAPGTAVHFGGTARMHKSREYGVVDEWSRIFDVPNVAVVDASTFTTGSEKNPTLTAMALAARAAHRIADDLKQG
jgi:choline dehydrogenase-like flavoprotein